MSSLEETYEITNPDAQSTFQWTVSNSTAILMGTIQTLEFNSAEDVDIQIVENRLGCTDTLDFTVDVLPTPDPGAILGGGIFCQSDDINLTIQNPTTGSSFVWTSSETTDGFNLNASTDSAELIHTCLLYTSPSPRDA